jgi:hypothetical protein
MNNSLDIKKYPNGIDLFLTRLKSKATYFCTMTTCVRQHTRTSNERKLRETIPWSSLQLRCTTTDDLSNRYSNHVRLTESHYRGMNCVYCAAAKPEPKCRCDVKITGNGKGKGIRLLRWWRDHVYRQLCKKICVLRVIFTKCIKKTPSGEIVSVWTRMASSPILLKGATKFGIRWGGRRGGIDLCCRDYFVRTGPMKPLHYHSFSCRFPTGTQGPFRGFCDHTYN